MREVFHLCGRVRFPLVPRSRFLDVTLRSTKKTPPKFLLRERCVTSKKRLQGKLDSHRWVKNAVVSRSCPRSFSPGTPYPVLPSPKKQSGNEDTPWNLIFNDLYFIYYPTASLTTLFSAWRNCYMRGKNPYGTLGHRASHDIYFYFIIYLI